MRYIHTSGLAAIALGLLAVSAGVMAQSEDKPFPAEARKRLDYAIGKWRSNTEHLDAEGNVRSKSVSEDRREFVIGDRVVEIVGVVNGGASTFRAWEYYNVAEGKYTLTSVDRKGELWTMEGDLGEEFRWTARRTRGGSEVMMRFTHYDIEENSFTALGEFSKDGGQTWRAFTRQYLTRIEE